MPEVSHCNDVSTSDGWEHGRDEVDSAEVFELFGIEIVPASVVHPLPEQFNRGLSAIFFLLRHVQVVNEDHDFVFAFFGPEVTFSSPGADLGVDESLDLVGDGLSRKGSGQECVLLIVVVDVELVCDIDGLASACGTAEEDVHVIFDVEIQEVVMPDAVVGGDDEIVVTDVFRDDKGRHGLGPILPNQFIHVVEHVEDVDFFRQLGSVNDRVQSIIRVDLALRNNVGTAIDQVDEECVEQFARGFLKRDSDRPDGAEHHQVRNDVLDLLRNLRLFVRVRLQIRLQNPK